MRYRLPGDCRYTGRERRISPARACAGYFAFDARIIWVCRVTIPVVQGLAVAADANDCHVVTCRGWSANSYRRLAVIVGVGRLVSRTTNGWRIRPCIVNRNRKSATTIASFRRNAYYGAADREEGTRSRRRSYGPAIAGGDRIVKRYVSTALIIFRGIG